MIRNIYFKSINYYAWFLYLEDLQDVNKQDVNRQDVNKQGVNKQGVNKQDVKRQDVKRQGVNRQGVNKQDVNKHVDQILWNIFCNHTRSKQKSNRRFKIE